MTPSVGPTTVTLVRHLAVSSEVEGRCYGQRLDPGLADDAAPPAPQLSALSQVAFRRTSPAARARATAALIDGGPWTEDAAWAERNFGEWEGRRWDACWADVPAAALDSAEAYLGFDPPGAERYDAVASRVSGALDALAAGRHLIITHAGPIRAALSAACAWGPDQVFSATIGHGGVVVLNHGQDGWTARIGLPGTDDREERPDPAKGPT